MGTYVNDQKVTLGSSYDYDDAVREIGALLGVGPREDGNYYLADVCEAKSVNKWAKHKPLIYYSPIIDSMYEGEHAAGYDEDGRMGGMIHDKAACQGGPLQALFDSNFLMMYYNQPAGSYYKRIRDFDGYSHNPGWWRGMYGEWPSPIGIGSISSTRIVPGKSFGYDIDIRANSDPNILQGFDILKIMGYYPGVLIVRGTLNNGYPTSMKHNNEDRLVVTTEKPLWEYLDGTTKDSNGLVQVGATRPSTVNWANFSLSFTLPKESQLTNSTAGFDKWKGTEVNAYPIISDKPLCFMDNYDSSARIAKLALDNDSWSGAILSVSEPTSGDIIEPTIEITCSSYNIQNEYLYLSNLKIEAVGEHVSGIQYLVSMSSVYSCMYKWNSGLGEWQTTSSGLEGMSDVSGSGYVLGNGGRTTLYNATSVRSLYKLQSGKYKLVMYANGTYTYNNQSTPFVGSTFELEFTV